MRPTQMIEDLPTSLYLEEERRLATSIIDILRDRDLETCLTALSIAMFAALTCYDDPHGALEDTYDELRGNLDRAAGHTDEPEAAEEEVQGTIVATDTGPSLDA